MLLSKRNLKAKQIPTPMKSDNLDDFFHLDDFAVEVSFTNTQGNKETSLVQFDAHPIDSHLGQIDYEINQPQITGSYQDLKA